MQRSLDFFYNQNSLSGQKKKLNSSSRDEVSGDGNKQQAKDTGFKRLKKTKDTDQEKHVEQEKLNKADSKQTISLLDTAPTSKADDKKSESSITLGTDNANKSPAKKKQDIKGTALIGVGEKSVAAAEKHKKYNSKDNAVWNAGKPVPYSFLTNAFDKIAEDSKRLAKTQILTEVMRSVIATTPEDLLPLIYLSVNRIAPAHEGVELGIGDATIIKALAESTGRKDSAISKEYKEAGDLGTVAQACRSTQKTIFEPKPLYIRQLFADFKAIALTEGEKSIERKRNIIKKILTSSKKSEASYVVRALQGKLRIGLAEQTVLTSLAHAIMLERDDVKGVQMADALEEGSRIVKQVYSECPCYDSIVPALLEGGVYKLPEQCKFTVGIPVKPMLAKPTSGVQEVLEKFSGEEFTCEYKYDGERAQVHIQPEFTKIFSRNAEDNTSKYPDIVIDTVPKILKEGTKSIVIDGEVVAYDTEKDEILPFQQLQTRKRKDVASEEITIKVCLFAFDCLYLNGQSLLQSSLKERREKLYAALNEVHSKFYFAVKKTSEDVEELQLFLDDSIKDNTEGLIVKSLDSTYEPSKRSLNWLKLKKDYMDGLGDSVDLVVLGAWYGKGKRTGNYGTFLLGCYNEENEEYETITKIGTGFSDEDLDCHYNSLKEHVIDCPRPYYKWGEKLEPDVWFDAVTVWEVKAADLTISPVHKAAMGLADGEKGIALRFPRFLKVRDDRTPTSATKSTEIFDLYSKQFDKTSDKKENASDSELED